jgi:subtilisin family serine protease
MVSKVYNELIVQYSDNSGFLHYANQVEGANLHSGVTANGAFEALESGDLQFIRFLNTSTNDHVFTADTNEITALQQNPDFVEEGAIFRLSSTETLGTQAVHRFLNSDTGFHHYVTESSEVSRLTESNSFISEGIVGYGGVVDTIESLQIAGTSSTISLTNEYDAQSISSNGSFNISLSPNNFSFGSTSGSITAMLSSGEQLPEFLGYDESSGQIYGYTLKEGLEATNVTVLADDGTSQVTTNFVISGVDTNDKTEADQFTEKSFKAAMSIETTAVGGRFTIDKAAMADNSLTTLATPGESSNLAGFQSANPTIDGSGTTIAVLDTGIDLNHPFFGADANNDGRSDRIVGAQDFVGDGNGAQDSGSHGTHVAGIAMSSDGTHPGTAPGANVAAIQVLGARGGSFAGIESGLQWVLDNRAELNITSVNMSLGASNNSSSTQLTGLSDEIAALKAQGVITFVAAGNSFANFNQEGVSTPASDPNALAISALSASNDAAASYSQRDSTLTKVFAPGTGITNAAPGEGGALQTLSGTSMATPYVAGVSSLMKQLNPNLTAEEFETFLQSSASIFNDPATGSDYRQLDVEALGTLVAGGSLPERPTTPAPTEPTDDNPDTPGSNNAALVAGTSLTGELEAARDKDVVALTVSAGSSYQIDLRGAPSSLGTLTDPLVRVLDGSGAQLAINDDGGTGLESKVIYTATSAGTVFVEARAFSTQTGTYQIDATLLTSDDHLDTISGTNTDLSAGTSQTGELETARDKDVFSFATEANGTYQVDLRGSQSSLGTLSDPFLRVLDSNGGQIAINDDGGIGLESRLSFDTSSAGTVYIEAGGFSTTTGTYQVDITDMTTRDDQPNVIGGNIALAVGTSQSGDIEASRDVDVFSLDVDAGTVYTIEQKGFFSSVGTLRDPLLSLRDSNGNLIARNDDGGFRLESQINYTPSESQTVYVEAGAFGTRTGTYEVSVGAIVPVVDAPDTPSSDSPSITAGTALNSTLEVGGDRDTFSLSVAAGSTYQIDLRGSASDVGTLTDPFLRVINLTGDELAKNDDGGTAFESRLDFTAASTGEVFIEARGYNSILTGSYQIDVVQTSTSTSSLGDLIGDSAEHAPLTSMGSIFGGTIDFHGDVDMYQFALEAGQSYEFNIRGSNSSHGTLWDPQAILFNSNGAVVAQDDDSGTGFDAKITFTATESDSYYLDVLGNIGELSQTTGTYSVESLFLG